MPKKRQRAVMDANSGMLVTLSVQGMSCVLHMDEKTSYLHATVVPIVTGECKRKFRVGEKKVSNTGWTVFVG